MRKTAHAIAEKAIEAYRTLINDTAYLLDATPAYAGIGRLGLATENQSYMLPTEMFQDPRNKHQAKTRGKKTSRKSKAKVIIGKDGQKHIKKKRNGNRH